MSFKSGKIREIKVLQFHQICIEFPNILYPLKYQINEIKSKLFLKKSHKFTNDCFRIVITWKIRNKRSLVPVYFCVLLTKEIVLVVYLTLVKSSVIQDLDDMNIIIKLKVQNHRNSFKKISKTRLLFKCSKKLEDELRDIIYGNLMLTNERTFERLVLFRNGVT